MCNGFGVDSPAVIGLIAVCVVLSPILVPAVAVSVAASAATSKASKVKRERRTTNLLRKVKNRFVKRLKAGEWQGYLQDVFDRAQADPSFENLHELGVAMLIADDAVKSEQYLSSAAAKAEWAVDSCSWSCPEEAARLPEFAEKLAAILFARGLANQTLRDYNHAIEDFARAARLLDEAVAKQEAGGAPKPEEALPAAVADHEAPKALPKLTSAECHNSSGYSRYLKALYAIMQARDFVRLGTEMALDGYMDLPLPQTAAAEIAAFARSQSTDTRVAQARALLEASATSYDAAVALTEEPRGMFIFNRGKAKYYLGLLTAMGAASLGEVGQGTLHLRDEERLLVEEALADFDACVSLENFGTTAEGHAMRAQALAVLGRMDEAAPAAEKAAALDPRTFLVDLAAPEQLLTPWPLPPPPRGDQSHDFEERTFMAPHFCDHCLSLLPGLCAAACCRRCEFVVHRACLDKAQKLKTCWHSSEEREGAAEAHGARSFSLRRMFGLTQGGENATPEAHVHKMAFVHFHKPTWCDACGEFALVPWGYRCVECRYRAHVDCVDGLTNCVMVEKHAEVTGL